ncbi:MAG: acetate--CoA ligase family protein [Deltaproteobacteria bacterium]|nr:acetate--CoA ligase family protein [Deltaproteobacteria bacterium]OQX65393.1 MAG: carboxylate--amine ligase [Desulfococcus sp. 4484_242]
MEIIEKALAQGRNMLSEYESKQVLSAYGIPVTREALVNDLNGLKAAAGQIGYPLVLKGCSPEIAHKTEKGLIKVDIRNEAEAVSALEEIMGQMGRGPEILVQEMVKGQRELVIGLTRDPQFGPCVMFGLGGIFTEILKDISFRVAPLEKRDSLEMMKDIKGHKILEAVRGMEAADLDMFSDMLIKVGQIGLENDAVKEIDINPVIIRGSRPVAVDALVVLDRKEG